MRAPGSTDADANWATQRGRQLPRDAPTADEMRMACDAAIDEWILGPSEGFPIASLGMWKA